MKKTLVILSVLVCSTVLHAQNTNMNPTVQVTNDYESRIADADRDVVKTVVPDSLYTFDLNFDYGGFENPYKGNDEFNPYLTDLDMAPRGLDARNLYLKVGAGYTLHPVLDAVYRFNTPGRFKADVYASHNSYYGNYWSFRNDGAPVKGYDAVSAVGFDFRSDWDKLSLVAAVGYNGVHNENNLFARDSRNFNSASASFKLFSNNDRKTEFWRYEVAGSYSYAGDSFSLYDARKFGYEHNGSLSAKGKFSVGRHLAELDAAVNLTAGTYFDEDYLGYTVTLAPKYHFSDVNLDAGVGLEFLVAGGRNVRVGNAFALWPSVKLNWRALPGYIDVFLNSGMKGGLFGQSEIAGKYRFCFGVNNVDGVFAITRTQSVDLGAKGDLWEAFSWKVKAGYDRVVNAPAAAVTSLAVPCVETVFDSNVLQNFNFGLDLRLRLAGFEVDGYVTYFAYLKQKDHSVVPPSLLADLRLGYDFLKRARLYVGTEYRSAYKCGVYNVPDVINLYAGADYCLINRLRLFVEGRNLLNRQCQYVPLFAEKGVAITVGAVLNF